MTTLPQTTGMQQVPRPLGPAGPMAITPPGSTGNTALSGAHHTQAQLTGADVWRVIRSNWLLIIGSVLASAVLGVVLNFYLAKFHARYTAVGFIKVQPNLSSMYSWMRPGAQDAAVDDSSTLIVEQRTQAQLLRNDALFSAVLKDANAPIRKTDWFKQFLTSDGTPDTASAKEDLNKYFSAVPYADTKLIAVSMTYSNNKDCRTIVENIVNQHLEEQRKNANYTLDKRISALNQMRNRYEGMLRQKKNDMLRDSRTMTMAGMADPTRMSQKEIELSELVRLKLKAESDAAQAKGALDNAQQTMAQGGTPGAVEMMIGNNYVVTNLKMQLVQTDIVLKSIMKQGSESDQYQSLRKSRDATEDMLNEMMAEERARTTAAYLDSLQGQAAGTQHDLDEVNKTIEKLTMEQAENAAHLAEYLANKDEQTALVEEIRRITNQTDVLNTAQQQLEMNSVSWMAHPETPDTPSFPVLKWTLTVSMVLGLALSLTVSFLRELMDTSVRSPRDIARVGQLNLLGTIPHEDDDPQAAGVPLSSVIYAAPSSMLAEQLRQVRTRLQHTASLETTRSILVTSPGPGDGKTTIACNLAAGLALNGHRILLVDANFRRPELHKLFGTGNEVGFSNVLSSVENFESAVRQTRVPNLDIMASGPKPANATEMLESQLLTDFIDRALEEYDHVVFDSGPMLVVSETVALAPRVDGVVTVVRARNNSRGLLQRMKENLRQLKAEHLGVVLNGVRSTGGGYYGRNIKAYYEYQNQNGDAA